MIDEEKIRILVKEELTKAEVNSLINNKVESILQSNEFKRKVKAIPADVLEDLYRTMYQKKAFWQSSVKQGSYMNEDIKNRKFSDVKRINFLMI